MVCYSSWFFMVLTFAPYLLFPVLLALNIPTFLPGGAKRGAMVGLPLCLPLPEPKGWSTAFIATPETIGYSLLRAFIM